jgi:hypothetical protein
VESQDYSTGSKLEEEDMLIAFFVKSTGDPPSGAERETRDLEIPEHEWESQLYAATPVLLQAVARNNPRLLQEHQGGKNQIITKFQANLRAAVATAKQPGYDPEKVRKDRLQASWRAYAIMLARNGGLILGPSETEKEAAKAQK